MSNLTPFVKWVGGKRQIIDILQNHLPEQYDRYFEPFIGGGALLFHIQPKKATVNDINQQLINTYQWIKFDVELVIRLLCIFDNIDCNKDYYYTLRDLYNQKINLRIFDAEAAALMIWINKRCFNGLYRVNKNGFFNVPYNNKVSGVSADKDNLRNISKYLNTNDIQILNLDFEQSLSDIHHNDFVYFDSPYDPISNTANFTQYNKNGFTQSDHCRLYHVFKSLDNIGVKCMLSNHDTELIRNLYRNFNIQNINVKRSINRNSSLRTGQELIITNY